MLWVPVQKPFEFFPGLFPSTGGVGDVPAHLRIAIQREEAVEIAGQEVSQDEAFGLQDLHERGSFAISGGYDRLYGL
jgi:hypothetical protein